MSELLRQALELELNTSKWHQLVEAREDLTHRYRHPSDKKQNFMTTEAHRDAYLAVRMPATYAVIQRVLQEILRRTGVENVKTLLDLGAGPGTAMWAAYQVFTTLESLTLIEQDAHLIKLGQRLMKHNSALNPTAITWQAQDLLNAPFFEPHDLIILSYSVGELAEEKVPTLIQKCWEATERYLVVIESGTPQGFERIRAIRSRLIDLGAHLLAPCPHALACPMMGGDWCHFAERVERSSLHRRLKGGSLGHEDEKYSYVIFSKQAYPLPQGRVLRHPLKRSGHIHLHLCTPSGLKQEVVSRKTSEAYKQARKVEWGDVYPDSTISSDENTL